MIVRDRRLYIGLSVVIAVLYGPLVLGGLPKPSTIKAAFRQARETQAAQAKPLEIERLQRALDESRQRPALVALIGALTALGLGVGVSGLALSLRLLVSGRWRTLLRYPGRLPYRWQFADVGRIVMLLAAVALMLPFVQLALMAWDPQRFVDAHVWSVSGMLTLHGLLLLLVAAFATASGVRLGAMFGLSRSRAIDAIRQSLARYVTAVPWIFLVLIVMASLAQRLGLQPPIEPIHELIFGERRPALIAATIVLACVAGPIAEELLFRGLLFSALRVRCSRVWAMLLSGSLFAAVHTNLIGFVSITLLGMLLADCYERTGSLAGPIAVHVVHNSALMALALTLKALGVIG